VIQAAAPAQGKPCSKDEKEKNLWVQKDKKTKPSVSNETRSMKKRSKAVAMAAARAEASKPLRMRKQTKPLPVKDTKRKEDTTAASYLYNVHTSMPAGRRTINNQLCLTEKQLAVQFPQAYKKLIKAKRVVPLTSGSVSIKSKRRVSAVAKPFMPALSKPDASKPRYVVQYDEDEDEDAETKDESDSSSDSSSDSESEESDLDSESDLENDADTTENKQQTSGSAKIDRMERMVRSWFVKDDGLQYLSANLHQELKANVTKSFAQSSFKAFVAAADMDVLAQVYVRYARRVEVYPEVLRRYLLHAMTQSKRLNERAFNRMLQDATYYMKDTQHLVKHGKEHKLIPDSDLVERIGQMAVRNENAELLTDIEPYLDSDIRRSLTSMVVDHTDKYAEGHALIPILFQRRFNSVTQDVGQMKEWLIQLLNQLSQGYQYASLVFVELLRRIDETKRLFAWKEVLQFTVDNHIPKVMRDIWIYLPEHALRSWKENGDHSALLARAIRLYEARYARREQIEAAEKLRRPASSVVPSRASSVLSDEKKKEAEQLDIIKELLKWGHYDMREISVVAMDVKGSTPAIMLLDDFIQGKSLQDQLVPKPLPFNPPAGEEDYVSSSSSASSVSGSSVSSTNNKRRT
jgi:hypothetical protein